jgi:hypothetical protein
MRTKQPHPVPIRDRALKQLAAESRSFAEQHAETAQTVRELREQYEREISSLPRVKTYLDELKGKGVNTERVLMCLASLVQLERHAEWQSKTKKIKTNLQMLAGRLRSIAGEVEGEYSADTIRPDLWAMSLGVRRVPAAPYNHRKAVECMRETVADLEKKARGFGHLSKDNTPVVKREPIVALLRCVCTPENVQRTSDRARPEFPPKLQLRLAELLDTVCGKYCMKSFTPDSLLKTFNRHVLRPSE